MTGQPLQFDMLIASANNADLTALADKMSDALSRKMLSKPGYTPVDQLAVHLIALARCCAPACVTLPGGYAQNCRSFAHALEQHIMAAQLSAEMAVKAAYVGIPANKAAIGPVSTVATPLHKTEQ